MTLESTVLQLAATVVDECDTRGLTLAVAESCTGGLVSSFLTDIDGSSEVLPFGLVVYSAEAKEEFVGVPGYVLRDFGTVSIECAKVMAEGLLSYEVDIGLSTTGVIGDSIENKLKGTVFIAVAVAGNPTFGKELVLDPKLGRRELKLVIVKQLFEVLLHVLDEVF
jgi:PncC family amidohydrolase